MPLGASNGNGRNEPAPHPCRHLLTEANEDPEKKIIVDYMLHIKTSNKSYDENLHFWRNYLLEHHADHHPP